MTRKEALEEILTYACQASEIYVNGRKSVKLIEKTGQLFYIGDGAEMTLVTEAIPNWNLQKDFGYLMELNDGVRFTMWQSKAIDGNPCISIAAMK